MELNPDDLSLAVGVAALKAAVHDERGARGTLVTTLKSVQADAVPASVWAELAMVASKLELLTVAEDALARAGPDAGAGAAGDRALSTRRWLGMQRDAGAFETAPEKEPELVDGLRRGFELCEDGKPRPALVEAERLRQLFPNVAGPRALACYAFQILGLRVEARRACQDALAASDEVIPAHVALALLAIRQSKWKDARAQFERALELDSSKDALWSLVHDAYRKAGRVAWAEEVSRRYEERFLRPLPR
jgi:tetratricopeptide (TPR) repeat protein